MTAATNPKDQARDLEADLAICEAATPGPWNWTWDGLCLSSEGAADSGDYVAWVQHTAGGPNDADRVLISEARGGWPYAIRRAMEAEAEIDRLRNELQIQQEQRAVSERLIYQEQQRGSRGCWD